MATKKVNQIAGGIFTVLALLFLFLAYFQYTKPSIMNQTGIQHGHTCCILLYLIFFGNLTHAAVLGWQNKLIPDKKKN